MSSYYVARNKSQAFRDKWNADHPNKNINWNNFPEPPECGGPTFFCVFYRTFCDDSTQGTFETAAVRLATDELFMESCPWIKRISAEDSDGCTVQFQCTGAALYNYMNPYLDAKNCREKGEGKGVNDTDDGKDKPKIANAMNKQEGSMRCAYELHQLLDKDRARGNINLEGTFGSRPGAKVPPHFQDLKFYRCDNKELCNHEWFSKRHSQLAGKLMGFSPGWRFDEKQLTDDCAYSQLETPIAHLKVHAERSFRSGDALGNFKPLLGRDQKSALKASVKARRTQVDQRRLERRNVEERRRAAVYVDELVRCDDCAAAFGTAAALLKHTTRGCGVWRTQKAARRTQLYSESVESRLAASDDQELEEAIVRQANEPGDIFEIGLLSATPGMVLYAFDPASETSMPLDCAGIAFIEVLIC